MKPGWKCALELRPDRTVASGSMEDLCDVIQRGADLRVFTEWNFEEHIAPELAFPNPEHNGLIQEVIDMRETIVVDGRYAAGITTLRQPILPCTGFNSSAPDRMSFFLYGMDSRLVPTFYSMAPCVQACRA